MEQVRSLTPTLTLIAGSIINHVYKEDKNLTTKDVMIFLSPTIPTILPIIISLIIAFTTFMLTFFAKKSDFHIFSSIRELTAGIFNLANRTTKNTENTEAPKLYTLELSVTPTFVQSLVYYIRNNQQTCNYRVDYNDKKMKIENRCISEESQVWKNIVIKYANIEIYVNDLNLIFTRIGDNLYVKNFIRYYGVATTNRNYTRLTDFMDDEWLLKKELREFVDHAFENKSISYNSIPVNTYDDLFIKFITKHYPNIDGCKFMAEFVVFDEIYSTATGHFFSRELITSAINQKLFRLFNSLIDTSTDDKELSKMSKFNYSDELTKAHKNLKKQEGITSIFDMDSRLCTIYHGILASSNSNSTENLSTLNLSVLNLQIPPEKAEEIVINFIDEITHILVSIPIGTKIMIYNTKIEQQTVLEKKPNPEYAIYEQQKNQILQLEKNEINSLLITDFMKSSVPSKELTETVTKTVVLTQKVNEKYKSLDTLYLRKNDMTNLMKHLNNFKNHKELYDQYGLQHKLGIMLAGFPGTGKTTTIYAIASFLQKSIYYVNFSTIESNEHLQMVFDEVMTRTANGGIIVFEDIDAMTSVVHDRTKTNHQVNSNLTLEYFLNILQGSLTRDDSVFIVTTNHLEVLDPAFRRTGRFDVIIDMKKCDHYQISIIYKKFIGKHIDPEVLAKIQEDTHTPADIIFHLIKFIDCSCEESCETIMMPFIST